MYWILAAVFLLIGALLACSGLVIQAIIKNLSMPSRRKHSRR